VCRLAALFVAGVAPGVFAGVAAGSRLTRRRNALQVALAVSVIAVGF